MIRDGDGELRAAVPRPKFPDYLRLGLRALGVDPSEAPAERRA
jgi:hypothetical protein